MLKVIPDIWTQLTLTKKYGQKCSTDVDRIEMVFGECEHGNTNIREDEVLSHEIEEVKEVLGGLL